MTRDELHAKLCMVPRCTDNYTPGTNCEVMRIADAYAADLRARLAEVERENAALKSGKWAGPWEPCHLGWRRKCREGFGCIAYQLSDGAYRARVGDTHYGAAQVDHKGDTREAAMAAADAALVAAGWYLVGGPARAAGDTEE